jgi:XTP/dITP diphosphohydrolase
VTVVVDEAGGLARIVVASSNPHKVAEIAAILDGLGVTLEPMSDHGVPEPVEDGETFEVNALLKARACAKWTGLPAIADDSGIAVDALDGRPGVHSARYAGQPTDDAANNALLLLELADRPRPWRARFVCAAALVAPDGSERVVRGEMPGQVVDTPRGTRGFGYDPLFVADATPDGRTNGELAPEEKDAISHRGAAFRALRPHVEELAVRR